MPNPMPDHLINFPCMKPWIGSHYRDRRLLVVCESHYLPNCITTLHHDETTWYESRQYDVPNPAIHSGVTALSYMDTIESIKHHRCKKRIATYARIEKATGMTFDDFAFFNYIFRPVEECARNYYHPKFNIGAKDREISKVIMDWFIRKHCPRQIIVASTCVINYGGVKDVLAGHKDIHVLYTSHPLAARFGKEVRRMIAGT